MVVFPNCKINLGLQILRRRPDGFHDVSTVMVPVPWCDVLEVVPSPTDNDSLSVTGRPVCCPPEKNLVMKALRALRDAVPVPPVEIHLHKIIPDGAGLGGGSADAAFTVMAVNSLFSLGLSDSQMASVLASVGSDCPFFVYNRPMLASGTGTDLSPVPLGLSGTSVVIAKPAGCSVSTAQAYAGVTPDDSVTPLSELILAHPSQWQRLIVNSFEPSVFSAAPAIARVKDSMLSLGASYAAMSGSGAAVFGLFDSLPPHDTLAAAFPGCDLFAGRII